MEEFQGSLLAGLGADRVRVVHRARRRHDSLYRSRTQLRGAGKPKAEREDSHKDALFQRASQDEGAKR